MMRLALSLGCTVKELSEKIDSRELTEWMVYYSMEPWGSQIEGYRDALSCATVANAGLFSCAPKVLKTNPFKPKDFLVTPSISQEEQDKNTRDSAFIKQKHIMDKNMIIHNKNIRKSK